ncbi:MAG TPA: urate oxidase [Bryobacteraceae bacterium]|nr:urate oxidase [Bryobacteraceae bacterium]
MHHFASGAKRNYYGKGDVVAYRLQRDGRVAEGQSPVFGANVTILIYGDAFWPTYSTGDNTGLVATDSMKNFVQRETLAYTGTGLESYARFLAEKFLATYPQTEGVQIEAVEIPYAEIPDSKVAFAPAGPERATVRLELQRNNHEFGMVEVCSGIRGFKLLRLGGSAFTGFVRDQYTTLPEIKNRPLHMWLDLEWSYVDSEAAFHGGVTARVRAKVHEIFNGFESGSIQEIIYKIGMAVLEQIPGIAEVRLEANNRTWDAVVEVGQEVGVYTEARPPFGCLGLTLHR